MIKLYYRYSWDTEKYSWFLSVKKFSRFIGLFLVLPFLSLYLGYSDPIVAIIGTISAMFGYSIMAIGQRSWTGPNKNWDPGWLMYLSAVCQWNHVVNVSINSQITKIFDKSEFGQILSIVSIVQCLVPLIASPLFGLIYKATLDTFEGSYLLTVVALLPFIIGSNIYTTRKKTNNDYKTIICTEE